MRTRSLRLAREPLLVTGRGEYFGPRRTSILSNTRPVSIWTRRSAARRDGYRFIDLNSEPREGISKIDWYWPIERGGFALQLK